MMFETLAFHDTPPHNWANAYKLSPELVLSEKIHHTYTGHLYADYHYNVLSWLAIGFQTDFEGIFWQERDVDRYGNAISGTFHSRNYNLCLLPEFRFTYCHTKYVNLYSGFSVGLNIAFDNTGAHEQAVAFNLNLFSIQTGKDHWYGTFELGLLNSLKNINRIYMIGSRIMQVGVGYRL
jgi:hypothetical protein